MRARTLLAVPLAALSVGALAACIDLFHSTDFDTMCTAQPSTDGCAPDALAEGAPLADGPQNQGDAPPSPDADAADDAGDSAPPPTDFCTWSATKAHAAAHNACAWLGACAGPLGNNKFGTCLGNAILAYDCVASLHGLPVNGRAHEFWDCMSKIQNGSTCDDVMRCIFPGGTQTCASSSTEYGACGTAEPNARLDCAPAGGAPVGVEECIVAGQACGGAGKICVGSTTVCPGVGSWCAGTSVHDCVNTGGQEVDDVGVDCAFVGYGACASPEGGTPSCIPYKSQPCTPTTDVTCTGAGNVLAIGCASGYQTTVDCRAFMEDAGTCNPSPTGGRPWDLTRACVPSSQQSCTESCLADGGLLACHHGMPVEVPCGAYGLKPCQTVTNFLVSAPACAPP